MNKNIILFLTVGLLLLVGCAKEPGWADAGSITVQASIGQMTKVSYTADGIGTSFTAGDKIAVYGWIGGKEAVPASRAVNGVLNTLGTDGKWTPESPMLWKNKTDNHYFLGVFPAHAITDFKADPYTLDPAKYTDSDLLIATNLAGVTSKGGPVDLEFGHAMAKLVVNLKFGKDWEATPAVSGVKVTAKTGAIINYLGTPVVSATGNASDVNLTASASAPDGYAYSYSGLQVPQDGVRIITVVIGADEYVYEAADKIPLSQGKSTTIGLAVVGSGLVEVGSVTLSDWGDGAGLPGGAAEVNQGDQIVFKDSNLKELLLNNPQVNIFYDNEITMYEAAMVKSLKDLLGDALENGAPYTSFNEFQYFTGIKDEVGDSALPDGCFSHWTKLQEITLPESLSDFKCTTSDAVGILTDCPKLTTIKGKFSVDDRALVLPLSKDIFYLITVATGDDTSYCIPDGVTTICSRSIYGVKKLGVPATVNKILTSAFMFSESNKDTVYVYFQGVTPPVCENHPLGPEDHKKCDHVKICVPPVINNGSVDKTATNARIEQFKQAFGNDGNLMTFAYYTDWPFDSFINGYEFVDLGLPSGLKWATCNVGATKPEEYGDYFAWGETASKEIYGWPSYSMVEDTTPTKYIVSDYDILLPEDDAASFLWGHPWRIPKGEDWSELKNYCNNVWTNRNGVNGCLFTSKKNGKTIFLPAAGYGTTSNPALVGLKCNYWSSSLFVSDPNLACFMYILPGDQPIVDNTLRCWGLSIRPVTE